MKPLGELLLVCQEFGIVAPSSKELDLVNIIIDLRHRIKELENAKKD